MGFLGKLVKGVVNTALLPVDVVKDVVTMGGTLTDADKPYTLSRVDKVVESVEEAAEDIGDGDFL